ncbi:MAG TPA: YqiA/YcfP family alpha/beta fold hydrolase [Candidatus Obscuribacterales bacterium]
MIVDSELTDSDTLVIAFTNASGKLSLPVQDFLIAAGLTSLSRIVIFDRSHRFCLGGFPPEVPTFFNFLDLLREKIRSVNPKRLIVVGASVGGYTALLMGHLLEADQVVVFGPWCCLDSEALEKMGDPYLNREQRIVSKLAALPPDIKDFLRLRSILSQSNRKTKFYLHVSRYNLWDYRRALYLKGVPDLQIIPHYYATHGLATALAKEGRLKNCFRFPYRRDKRLKYYYILSRHLTRRCARGLNRRLKAVCKKIVLRGKVY